MKKKTLILLAILIFAVALPLSVSAGYGDVVDSGKCGENVTWKLTEYIGHYDFDIEGSGDMYNYGPDDEKPWDKYENLITLIVIGDEVTSIGDYAFADLSKLRNIGWGDKVKTIGKYAFANSLGDDVLDFPDSVETIGDYAFDGWKRLTTINFGTGVKTIGKGAFKGSESLWVLNIPDNIEIIGDEAFSGTESLRGVKIGKGVKGIGKGAFDKYMENVDFKWYFAGSKEESENITVASGNSAFDYACSTDNVKYETDGVLYSLIIAGDTNYYYVKLTGEAVKLPEKLSYEHQNCVFTGYTVTENGNKINYAPGSEYTYDENDILYPIFASLSGSCGENLNWKFENNTITISGSGDMTDYSSISDPMYAPWFTYREDVHKIELDERITNIGNLAFYGCVNITDLDLPKNVKRIGNGAFDCCYGLTSIDLPDGLEIIGNEAFELCYRVPEVVIPDSVTELGDSAFSDCIGLKKVKLSSKITSIKWYTFFGCESMEEIEIPGKITSIGLCAFYGCQQLKELNLPDTVKTIGFDAFGDCRSLKTITLPDSVTTLDKYSFEFCTDVTKVYIGSGIKKIVDYSFYGCNKITDVYYNGTEEQWKKISIGAYNTPLTRAKIHYMAISDGVHLGYDGYYRYYIDGVVQTGWQVTEDGYKYYFSSASDKKGAAMTGKNIRIGGACYDFTDEGKLISAYRVDGSPILYGRDLTAVILDSDGYYRYYLNNVAQTGWQVTKDGYKYYFSSSSARYGAAMTGKNVKVGSDYYDFTDEGKLISGYKEDGTPIIYGEENKITYVVKDSDGYYRYYVDGTPKTGWQVTPDGYKYYFSTSTSKYGAAMTGDNIRIGGAYYNFAPDGRLVESYDDYGIPTYYILLNGFKTDADGVTKYYVNNEHLINWQYIDGHKYYFSKSTGKMLTGYSKVGSIWYNFNEDGSWNGYEQTAYDPDECDGATDVVKETDGKYRYYVDDEPYKGWKVLKGENAYYKYYFSKSDGGAITSYATQVGGDIYDFKPNGTLISVTMDENGNAVMKDYTLSLEQGAKNGLTFDDDGEYRLYVDGEFLTGWQEVDGESYLFRRADGSAITSDDHQTEYGYRYGSFYYKFTDDGKLLLTTPTY